MEHILKWNEVSTFNISQNKKSATKETGEGKISRLEFSKRLDQMMKTIEALETKLTQKADEVVSYQVLTQRQEIDELNQLLSRIEKRLEKVEKNIEGHVEYSNDDEPIQLKRKDRRN